MNRMDFLKKSALAVGASTVLPHGNAWATTSPNSNATFNLDYAPHQGMFAASAGKNFLDEIQYMHDLGFRSIEDNGMPSRSEREQTQIGELLAKLGMRMGVFVVPKGGKGQKT